MWSCSIGSCMIWGRHWWIQNVAMLCYRDLFKVSIAHELIIFYHFQEHLLPMTVLSVDPNLLISVLLLFVIVLLGHCVVFLHFWLFDISLFVQLSCIHTIAMYWRGSRNVWECNTLGESLAFWQRNGRSTTNWLLGKEKIDLWLHDIGLFAIATIRRRIKCGCVYTTWSLVAWTRTNSGACNVTEPFTIFSALQNIVISVILSTWVPRLSFWSVSFIAIGL